MRVENQFYATNEHKHVSPNTIAEVIKKIIVIVIYLKVVYRIRSWTKELGGKMRLLLILTLYNVINVILAQLDISE